MRKDGTQTVSSASQCFSYALHVNSVNDYNRFMKLPDPDKPE